jgi:hypothetical protein
MAETATGQENCVECNSGPTLESPVSVPSLKIEDPTNKTTFVPPTVRRYPMVVIEYCDKVSASLRLRMGETDKLDSADG